MSFIDNILENIGICDLEQEQKFRYTVFGEKAGYFENVLGIRYYTEEEIALSLKRGGLIVRGEKLYIKKFCLGDVVICGKITAVERN